MGSTTATRSSGKSSGLWSSTSRGCSGPVGLHKPYYRRLYNSNYMKYSQAASYNGRLLYPTGQSSPTLCRSEEGSTDDTMRRNDRPGEGGGASYFAMSRARLCWLWSRSRVLALTPLVHRVANHLWVDLPFGAHRLLVHVQLTTTVERWDPYLDPPHATTSLRPVEPFYARRSDSRADTPIVQSTTQQAARLVGGCRSATRIRRHRLGGLLRLAAAPLLQVNHQLNDSYGGARSLSERQP